MGNWFKDKIEVFNSIGDLSQGKGNTADYYNLFDPGALYHTPGDGYKPSTPEAPGESAPGMVSAEGSGGTTAQQTMAEVLRDYLLGNPQVAEQQFGLTSQYLPQYADLLRGEISKDRSSGIADVANLLPAIQGIDRARQRPQTNAMMDLLFKQVGDELALGGNLSPAQSAQVNESVRSGQVARGTLSGTGAANREAVQRAIQSMDLLTNRQSKAQGLIGFDQGLQTNPFSTVLGINPAASSAATGLVGQGNNTLTPGLYAQNTWNTNSNNLAQEQFAQQQANQTNVLNLLKMNKDYAGIAGI